MRFDSRAYSGIGALLTAMKATNHPEHALFGWASDTVLEPFAHQLYVTVMHTLPLTAGFAVISVLVGFWLMESFCSLQWLLLLVLLVFCASGSVGTLTTQGLPAFMHTYDTWSMVRGGGLGRALASLIAYSLLSIVGFYNVYGSGDFFMSLGVGTISPYLVLYKLWRDYQKAEATVAREQAADGDASDGQAKGDRTDRRA